MWNPFSIRSNDSEDHLPSQDIRRNDDKRRHPANRSTSITSTPSNTKSACRADDLVPRGLNPTSSSYSYTTREQGSGAASISSSYAATSGDKNGELHMPPGLARNVSLADQMPSSSRSSRDQEQARQVRHKKRSKTERSDGRDQDVERRGKGAKQDRKDKSLRRTEEQLDEEFGTSRGPSDFPDQVTSSGFSQFPGQYDAAMPAPNGSTHGQPAMSSHVQDQFPGQFPAQVSAPYRPPLATSEGGPGLAAEYYGDAGQSVAEQPGNRVDTPSLIVGAEPHLQPALAVAAPPPEPSASGAVGAAASFFSGEFEEHEVTSSHGQQNSSTYATGQIRPNSNHHSSSAPVIPTIGGAVIGSAAGYLVDSQTSLHQQHPHQESSIAGGPSEYSSIAAHRPPSEIQVSHYPSTSQPTKPGKQPSQLSSSSMYAAEMAGAAGLATAAYAHNHHSSNQNSMSTSQYSTASMAQRRRNRGPLSALVDFFRDPEGVAQFEEYSQIIGICRHCFAPGSSPRDAPRKHFYGRRRSTERYGSSTRIDKDNRYYSSENEGRRKNKPWLATGLAGFGLAKMGESLFNEKDDFDDTYSSKNARFPPDGSNRKARRRSRSNEHVDIRITGDSKSDRKGARDDVSNGTKRSTHSIRRRSRTRSRSEDRENNVTKATVGAAFGASVAASSSRPRSRSPQGISVKSKRMSQAPSPERRHKTKKKRSRGFFSFGSGSSSSSSVDLVYTSSQSKHRSNNKSTSKSKDDKKAEAALLGLGAAAAALTLNDGRQGRRKKGVKEHARVRNNKDHGGHASEQAHRHKMSSGSPDDELWESAAEDDYESINSDLAYGTPARRDSRASLSSESSGTNKWGWRWGSKKHRRVSPPNQKSSDHSSFHAVATSAGAPLTGSALMSPNQHQGSAMTSTSSLPLQHVYPMPTSDPSRFDVGSEAPSGSANRPALSSRPEAVPLQHPRPIAPVSPAIYSGQMAYDHSYSAPAGVAVFPQAQYHRHPGASDARSSIHEASSPGNLPRFEQQADDTVRDFKIRRRDTSPAKFEVDAISSSMAPRRRSSVKDDTSAVRFDLTEEQEERERRERRRTREQDKERREAEKQDANERERRAAKRGSFEERGSKAKPEKGSQRPEKSWVAPTAAGVVGAAIASAAAAERSKSEETREERRERRRRERELEDEEDALKKSERRRRQRERADQEAAIHKSERLADEIPAPNSDGQDRSIKRRDMSVWQEAASTKRSSNHENYCAFFTPLEVLNKSSDQVKVTSANADADIDLEQVPQIVTVEPKRTHDLSDSPTFSLAGIDDKVDSSRPSFPWQVPRLRLVEPTPPSTRGSTPLLQPKDAGDEDFEEPRKDGPPSMVKWADDQNREYTIIAPKEDRDEFIEPVSEEIMDPGLVDLSGKKHERQSPDNETHQYKDSAMGSNSASYGEDVEFAATLAASAEDAGFDPSIVINNPTYRRRDSPPGSNERSIPGAFNDVDEPWPKKKQRKRKEKTSRRQSQNDGPDGRDDDKIVQDIISQVEESESQASDKVPSENLDDEWKSTGIFGFKKSEKGQKGSGSGENSAETSDLANKTFESKNDDVYKSPSEDVRSILSTSNEAESDSKSREESKRDSSGFDDAASTLIFPSATESNGSPKTKSKGKRKSSVWDRFLGKSTNNIPHDNSSNVATDEADLEAFDESEKLNRVPQERKPTGGRDDNHDSKGWNRTGSTAPQVPDRLSQDLPVQDQGTSLPSISLNAGSVAKYLDHGLELDQVEEKQPESFLGMRPEPPPPPDTGGVKEQLFTSLETTSLPTSPRAGLDTKNRRFSDAEISNKTRTTSALPSSTTAVPFHFRQPGRPSSTARSLSQTPLPSNPPSADPIPKQKIRPRSTESKSSKEIRPLWLVERHSSHHEPTRDEVYPSLPSSHTTSTSSSVVASEERENHHEGDYEVKETEHKPVEVEHAPIVSHLMQPDPFDSQQATPTASSFHHSSTALDIPSPQARRDLSPEAVVEDNPPCSNSTPKNGILGSINGGSAAVAMNQISENNFPSPEGLPQEEDEDLERGLDDTGLDTVIYPSCDDNPYQEEFSIQKPKKDKKSKRKAGQFRRGTVQPSLTETAEAKPSMEAINPDPLSPDDMRQIQEQDVQDAVDSWSSSVRSSAKVKRGKKGKNRMLVEKSPAETGSSSNAHESPGNNLGTVVSAEDQQNDSLTREISRKQVVDIMTAKPQDADEDEVEASQSATVVVQAPAKIEAEEDRIEPKGQTGTKGHMDLLQDDLEPDDVEEDDLPQDNSQTTSFPPEDIDIQTKTLPPRDIPQANFTQDDFSQDNLRRREIPQFKDQQKIQLQDDTLRLSSPQEDFSQSQSQEALSVQDDLHARNLPALSSFSAPATTNFEDQFLDKGHASQPESPRTNLASEEHNRGNPTTAAPLQLELSPRVTPLPDSDDEHKLLGGGLRTPILTPLHRYDDEEKGVVAVNPLDVSHLHDPSAITPTPQGQSQDLPSQADQSDAAEDFVVPSKEIPEMGKKPQQSFSGEDNKTTEIQGKDGPSPNVTTSTTLEDDWVKAVSAEPAADIPQGKSENLEDESGGFTNSARGDIEKEASQSSSAENSKIIEMHERQKMLPQMATLAALEDHETLKLLDESAVDGVFQPKTEPLKDDWTGFNEKEQSTEGEETKSNFSVGNTKTTSIGEESKSLLPFATLEQPEYRKALDLISEPAMHVPESELVEKVPKTLIDENSNQATKPKMFEDEWAGFNSKTGKSAQNQGSKTVHLGPGQEEAELQSEQQSDARDDLNASPSSFDMKRAPQISAELGSSKIENSVGDEPKEAFPSNSQVEHTLQKPFEDQTMGFDERKMPGSFEPENLQLENAFGKAHDGAKSPAPDRSVANTNAAEVVQEILAGENNAESATNAKGEAIAISTSMKDATTDSPMEKDEIVWDALKKKKKGKKGKKTEAISWDEPETLQPADVSSPSRELSARLEQEPAMDRPIEEDELDRDAPKKKKGKKGKKTEAISWDEPETLQLADVSSPSHELSTRLEQEPAMDRPIEEDEMDRDAPKKKKKGKKGKKIEEFFLDEPKVVEPVHFFDPPSAMKPSPLEQEAMAETNDEVFLKQSKKDKKNKKGKRKAVSRMSDDFRDEDEPSVVPTEIAQDEDLPAIARDSPEENKASGVLTQVSQGDPKAEEVHTVTRDSWNKVEADVVPTGSLQSEGQVEDRSAIDHPLVTNVVQEELESHPVTTEAPLDNDNVADAPTDVMLPSEADSVAPGERSITAVPTDFAHGDKSKASRDASLEQEGNLIPPKGKKDKKKSKKSKKSNTFSLDDDESPRPDDGQVAGPKVLEGELEQTTPPGADVFVESEQAVPKIRSEQEQDFQLPTKKKDRKKSKKYTSFPPDDDILPALEDEPASQPKSLKNEVPKETFPSSVGVINEPEANVEPLFENKDRDENEEAQPDNRKSEDLTTPPKPEPPKDLQSSGIDGSISSTKVMGDRGIVEGEREQPMHGEFYPISAHVSTPEIVQKPSSPVTLSLEQPANVPEETLTDHAKELKGNINPPVKTDIEFLSSPKPSKKDKKRAKKAKKAQAVTWEDDEVPQEAEATFNQSGASNDADELPIKPVSQYSESSSKPEISAQAAESTEIIQQDIGSGENRGLQRNALNETPSQAGHDIQNIVKADQDDSYVEVQRGENGEIPEDETRSIAVEEAGSPTSRKDFAWVETRSHVHESEPTPEEQPRGDVNIAAAIRSDHERPAVRLEKEQVRIPTEPEAIAKAKDEELTRHAPVQMTEKPRGPQDEANWDELMIEEQSSSVAPGSAQESVNMYRDIENVADVGPLESLGNDKPIPTIEVELLDAKEKNEYNEEYAAELERAIPNAGNVADPEPLGGPDIKKERPVPAVEVEMLDAQEQRNYNEEYAKELERQLSPLQEGEPAGFLRDEADIPLFSGSSTHSITGTPYEDDHRPLARPPALEDIVEESGSRPSSVQDTPVTREDEFQPIKSSKQGKKSKRGKKQQPVIWEDDTATPSLKPENGQGATPSEGLDSWATETARPLDLEERVHEQSFGDKTLASPTGDFGAAHKESEAENDRSGDYFAIQPSRPAEEDVGSEDTQEFRRALDTEPPYTEDRFPAQDTQPDQDVYMRNSASEHGNQDERLASLTADSHVTSRTEVEPAGEQVEDKFDPALMRTIDKGTKPEELSLAREPPPEALKHEDVMDPEILTVETLNDRSPSRQYSLQQLSHEDELSSVAEGRSTSRGKSRSTEGIAAAVGLGVGASAAESLFRRDSRRHGEKANEVGSSTDFEIETAEIQDPLDSLGRGQIASRAQEHRRTPESDRSWQHHQGAPPTPPGSSPYANHSVAGPSVEEDLGQSSETPEYRDSAIYVSGSPMISEVIPHDHTVRDSGYPDTEASPLIGHEVENLDTSRKLERGVAASATAENVQRRHSGAQDIERQRSTSRNPLEISVEANSDYDVSESEPLERRNCSRRRSGVAYDSDDSADSGFDIQRRRRRQAMAAEPREPSPVSSTTKDRSSALFDSSPSAREDTAPNPQNRGLSPGYDPVGEEPDWSFDREGSRRHRSQELSREGRSNVISESTPESTGYSMSTDHHEARGVSLFGGPQSHDDDLMSPSRSPRSSEGRGRQRLNTISEGSADESPLRRKDKRALSDVGSPESGIKGRRMRSPPVDSDTAGEHVSTHEPNSHEPWPAAEEVKREIEERSRSRNSDQLSTVSSRHSGWPGAAFGHREEDHRTTSAGSMRSEKNKNSTSTSIHAIIRTPDQVRSASGLSYRSSGTITPPLRRVDRSASGDLRGASKKDEAKSRAKISSEIINEPPDPDPEHDLDFANIKNLPSSSTYDPVTDKGKSRANNMTDVYEGWGDVRGQSPMSPTRPPSMRKRQSMQLLDLETRLDQLVSENRLLASQKLTAEHALQEQARDHSQERHAYEEAMREHKIYLERKDSELGELKKIIEQLHDQAAHLTEVNEELASSHGVHEEHEQRYSQLQADHAHTHEQWQHSTRELENLREQHTQLSTGMEDIVRHEVTVALEEKNIELRQLQSELENAKQQVRNLQQQLLASRSSDDFVERDEDYFDSRCQSLCQHVQQWVLRFSKFSDMKACYLAREVQDEKVVDRMENAILDGSDVDDYLSDRVKRRDVFMSVVMTMIWEFVFTRYLFGMDREQRQKLKNLEKTLQEVGPISAVHKWRATTLTLLMKREAFENQRATDTEAVVHEIYDTLATFLPPPSHLVGQIQDSLRKVIDAAVDLSIEMRTQRAEYSMLPPLQPEYDTNGDLARKVYFSALTMNERSGATSSNEALQEQQAVVRMVLFPLVVKNEDDDEQIVVCPAQVLTAEGSKGKKTVRVLSAQGGRSEASFAGSDVRVEGGLI